MRNLSNTIKTLLLSTVLIMASCQKDYYLEDLNDANAQIEVLESTIQSLLAQGDVDAKEIETLNNEIIVLENNLDIINQELIDQNLINDDLQAIIDGYMIELEDNAILIEELKAEIIALQEELSAQGSDITKYIDQIADLEDELAEAKANVRTIIEYVEVIVTETQVVTEVVTQVVTEVVEVEVPATPVVEVVVPAAVVTDTLIVEPVVLAAVVSPVVEEIAIPAVVEEEEAVVIAEPVITQDITQQLADTVLESELGELSFVYTNNDDDDIDLVDIIETITITYTDGVQTDTQIDISFVVSLDNTPEVVVEVVEEVEVNNSLFDTAFGEGAWGIVIDPYGNGGKKTLGDVIVNDQQTTYNVVMDMTDYGFLNTPSKSGKYTKAFQSATLYISFDKNSSVIDIELILNENFGGNASPSVNVSHFFN